MVFFEITYLEVSYRYNIFNPHTKKSPKNTKYVVALQRLHAYENCTKNITDDILQISILQSSFRQTKQTFEVSLQKAFFISICLLPSLLKNS